MTEKTPSTDAFNNERDGYCTGLETERHGVSQLVFVGDCGKDPQRLKKPRGKLPCVKHGSNKIFVGTDETNAEIPYIIVDTPPVSTSDFVAMRDGYGWDAETCQFLLPEIGNEVSPKPRVMEYSHFSDDKTEEEALAILADLNDRLNQKETILPAHDKETTPRIVPDTHKTLLREVVAKWEREVREKHGWKSPLNEPATIDYDNATKEQIDAYEQQGAEEAAYKKAHEMYHHFALCIVADGEPQWLLASVRLNDPWPGQPYNLVLETAYIGQNTTVPMFCSTSSRVAANS